MRIATLTLAAALAATPAAAFAAGKTAAPSYTVTTTTYSQDFDDLANSGTSQALPAGFQIVENGTGGAADGFYAAGTGSSNAGNAYSFGAADSTERALGSLGSGSVGPIWYGGVFTNGLGGTIESLTFGYDGELWRTGNSSNDGLTFQYSLNASQLDNGTWTTFAGLNYTPVAGVLSTSISATIGDLAIAQGESFAFRWVDVDSSGTDYGLGVDNLSITAALAQTGGAVPEPSAWALLILGFGLTGAAMRRRRQTLAFA